MSYTWSIKFMSRYGIKGYNILVTSKMKILADDAEIKYKGVTSIFKLTNNTAYNDMILVQ